MIKDKLYVRCRPGVECNMVILTEAAINSHYDRQHYLDRFSKTPIDSHYARIEQQREKALAIFRREGRLRVYGNWDDWRLIERGQWYEL